MCTLVCPRGAFQMVKSSPKPDCLSASCTERDCGLRPNTVLPTHLSEEKTHRTRTSRSALDFPCLLHRNFCTNHPAFTPMKMQTTPNRCTSAQIPGCATCTRYHYLIFTSPTRNVLQHSGNSLFISCRRNLTRTLPLVTRVLT